MVLTLEDLADAMIFFSPIQSQGFTENGIVALEHHNHTSICKMNLEGDYSEVVELAWTTTVIKNGYREKKKFTEKGAEAISFLIATSYTEYDVIEEAVIGTGIDYWLGYKEEHEKYDPNNFLNARLEISGILKETKANNIESRVKIKKDQTIPTDSLALPAYVSIVEFSNPKAYFAKK